MNIEKIINIGYDCLESEPCQHTVMYVDKTGKEKEDDFYGDTIWQMIKHLQETGDDLNDLEEWVYEHFEIYDEKYDDE